MCLSNSNVQCKMFVVDHEQLVKIKTDPNRPPEIYEAVSCEIMFLIV